MDIMFEAYEYHSIEQNDRKRKYEKVFQEEIEGKINKWKDVQEKHCKKMEFAEEDKHFMFNQIAYLFDSSLTDNVPYYKGFIDYVKKEHGFSKVIELFYKVLPIYFDFDAFISLRYGYLFRKKQVLLSCFEEARMIVESTHENAEKINGFIKGTYFFEEFFEEIEVKCKEIKMKINQKELLSENDIEWLVGFSGYSIIEQKNFGNLYFTHHFQRVKKSENQQNQLYEYMKVFFSLKEAIERVSLYSEQDIPLFGKKEFLERLKEMLSETKRDIGTEFWNVKRKIQQATT